MEALPKDKSAYDTSVAAKAIDFCNKIYHEENLLAELTPKERYEQCLVKVKPLLDASFAWLEDGNIPIDNNRAENAIRPLQWIVEKYCQRSKIQCHMVFYSFDCSGKRSGCRKISD